ncbi:hypothetical protein IBX35_04055 [Candidatus Bathyarchaeota archaeon]|nr:hypothetical protein [Candidatus Bathyarchaeota archaeon]
MEIRKTELLKRAARHFFSTGLGDGASYLCRENMKYGLAKIHIVQEKFGLDPNATFVSTPDETVTRNLTRWKAGFGYGGKLIWGSGTDKLIILDTKPNACGMLVGGLDELTEPKELIEQIQSVKKDFYIDDIQIDWDFCKGNHFIDLFKVVNESLELDLTEYAFIVHGSVPELRGETGKGLGLYFDKSESLKERSKVIETKFGNLHVLVDSDAEEFFKFYQYADFFAKEKRKMVAEAVFGKFQEICNVTHQGLLNYNELLLGCQNIKDQNSSVFPIALRADLPAFLMKGINNLDDEIIEVLGFAKRAENLGVIDRLRNANILPHGGGYTFNDFLNVREVIEINDKRYFVLDMQTDVGHKICSDVREMEFGYRGKNVVLRTVELRLAQILARLIPQYILKI